MNAQTILLFFVAAFTAASFGTGCAVDFDLDETDFPCAGDEDCTAGYECAADNICRAVASDPGVTSCIDNDEDGYGVGDPDDLANCPACNANEPGGCTPDCDDTNANVHPGAGEVCDGEDNNCDGDTDEQSSCTNDGDCPSESGYVAKCSDGGQCEYFGPIRLGAECLAPLQCTNAQRDPIPDACQ